MSEPAVHSAPTDSSTCTRSGQRRTADRYLSRFQSTPGSWRVCLQLLDQPGTLEQEKYFAATTLKTVCQKYHVRSVPRLLQQLWLSSYQQGWCSHTLIVARRISCISKWQQSCQGSWLCGSAPSWSSSRCKWDTCTPAAAIAQPGLAASWVTNQQQRHSPNAPPPVRATAAIACTLLCRTCLFLSRKSWWVWVHLLAGCP